MKQMTSVLGSAMMMGGVILFGVATAHAASISINFNNNADENFVGGELIGPLHQDSTNWNSTMLGSGTLTSLLDDSGTLVPGISVGWDSSGTYQNPADGYSNDEHRLATGYLDDWDWANDGTGVWIRISGIPYTTYRVYGLLSTDVASPTYNDWSVNGAWTWGGTRSGSPTITANMAANGAWWTEITTSTAGNYWVAFTSGSECTIWAAGKNHPGRAALSGLIIEEVSGMFVDITNDTFSTVHTPETMIGGTSGGGVGDMALVSVADGTPTYTASIPADPSWSAVVSNLVERATNVVTVTVTNAVGDSMSDTVQIYYKPMPCVDITNVVGSFISQEGTQYIAGTNSFRVVGGMVWTNSAGGGGVLDPTPGNWSFTATLYPGNNIITVYGTNEYGETAGDMVAIGVPPSVSAAISINFGYLNDEAFSGGQLIGPLLTDSTNWNSTFDASGTLTSLIDNEGNPVPGASLEWLSYGTWDDGVDGYSDDEHRLAMGYLDDWDSGVNTGTGVLIRLTGIPYAQYRVYGLLSTDAGNPCTYNDWSVNGSWIWGGPRSGSPNITANKAANGAWWTEITVGTPGNYWVTTATGDTCTVWSTIKYQPARGALSAIIIEKILSIDITNAPFTVQVPSNIVVAGTNNGFVVGDMWISNAANDQVASFPSAASWTSAGVPAELGANDVWVYGTNSDGIVASDMIEVVGVPEPAAMAALFAIGVLHALRSRSLFVWRSRMRGACRLE